MQLLAAFRTLVALNWKHHFFAIWASHHMARDPLRASKNVVEGPQNRNEGPSPCIILFIRSKSIIKPYSRKGKYRERKDQGVRITGGHLGACWRNPCSKKRSSHATLQLNIILGMKWKFYLIYWVSTMCHVQALVKWCARV